jgi:hypothetical protein
MLPAARWVAIYSPATLLIGLACIGFILLLTPTGSLPSRRWRLWARVAATGPALFLLALTFGPFLIPPYESVAKPLADSPLTPVMAVATVVAFSITVPSGPGPQGSDGAHAATRPAAAIRSAGPAS